MWVGPQYMKRCQGRTYTEKGPVGTQGEVANQRGLRDSHTCRCCGLKHPDSITVKKYVVEAAQSVVFVMVALAV